MRATTKYIREDSLQPAMLAIGTFRAREAGNAARADQLASLQLKAAIDSAAALETAEWRKIVFGSFSDMPGYDQFAGALADFLDRHPALEVSPSTRSYFVKFRTVQPEITPK